MQKVNTVDLNEVFSRQEELETAMKAENQAKGYDLYLLVVTDILNSNSELLVIGEPTAPVEAAFNVVLTANRAFLPGVVSRKKQVVPQLTESFNN